MVLVEENFALPKENLRLLVVGFVIILIGCICMLGGGSNDGVSYNPEIFSSMRITVAPIIMMIGFFFEIFAIIWVRRSKKTFSEDSYARPEDDNDGPELLEAGGDANSSQASFRGKRALRKLKK